MAMNSRALLLGCALLTGCQPAPGPDAPGGVTQALSGEDTAGFARALVPRTLSFPADHGPHPHYRNEWWYFTGQLHTAQGRRFGYQLTLFRIGLRPPAPGDPVRASRWATREVYMGHATLSDIDGPGGGRRFHTRERLSRAALGLAGATSDPIHIWLEDWRILRHPGPAERWEIRAQTPGFGLSLGLEARTPIVAQGDRGLSQKGSRPGNASYYYSIPGLRAQGTVSLDGETFQVEGEGWLDREWSTSALEPGQVGWDWFSLRLTRGRYLMYYRIRRRDGATDPHSAGMWLTPRGPLGLKAEDVRVEVLDRWDSPRGPSYPARWRLRVPSQGLDLIVTPLLRDQELALSVRYWEGAVEVRQAGTREPAGTGYVELTGYTAAD